MLSIRSRFILFGSLCSTLALAGLGTGIFLMKKSQDAATLIYQQEIRQTRLVENMSRRLTAIDADIASVALGSKAPLDAHEFIRKARPQIELDISQLRAQSDNFAGERLDLLQAIDRNLPDFYQLLSEIDQAYVDSDISQVTERFRMRWPIMRYSLIGPLQRLLYLQQTELDNVLQRSAHISRQLSLAALSAFIVLSALVALIARQLLKKVELDLHRIGTTLGFISEGHFGRRLEGFQTREVLGIADTINRTLAVLQTRYITQECQLRQQQMILEAVTDGVYCLDRGGRITYVNPAAQHLIGRAAKDLIGQKMQEIASADADLPLEKVQSEGPMFNLERQIQNQSGQAIPVELSILPLHGEFPDAAFIVVFRDISERLRKQTELLQAYREINQMSTRLDTVHTELHEAQKLAFYGRLASSITTPLTSHMIMLEQQIANLSPLTIAEEQSGILMVIRKELAEASKLIHDLRHYQTPDSGLAAHG